MSQWRFGCGKRIVGFYSKYDGREIYVECGSTSPSGYPYQCEKCERRHAGTDYRRDTIEAGEAFEEDQW